MKTVIEKGALICALLLGPVNALAVVEDDPVLTMVQFDQLEIRDTEEGSVSAWEGHVWVGKDINKLWIKFEGERNSESTLGAEVQALYSRAVDANWDLQLGFRRDFKPEPKRDWLAVGFSGTAPYWIDIDTGLYYERDGQVNLRFQAEYEIMLTQKWVLSPELEINWHSEDDLPLDIAAGLTDMELGLRLRYEIRRDFAPYIGVNHERLLGDSADLAKSAAVDSSESQVVLGLSFWF